MPIPPPTAQFPNRPQHEDFAWLSEHVIALDAGSEDPNFSVLAALAELPIDTASLTYIADTRAGMSLAHLDHTRILLGLLSSQRLALRALIGAAYLDAFVLGTAYGRKLAAEGR